MADVVESALRESRDLLAEHWFPDDRAERREKDAALARFDAAIETLRPRLSQAGAGGVVVKPLEWQTRPDGDLYADCSIGRYEVGLVHTYYVAILRIVIGNAAEDIRLPGIGGLEAVKSAAQADYEARVLAALAPWDTTPPAPPAPTASVEAADIVYAIREKTGRMEDGEFVQQYALNFEEAQKLIASLTPAPTDGDGA